MTPKSPTPRRSLSRTFLAAAVLLGLFGAVETGIVARRLLTRPEPAEAAAPTAQPNASPSPAAVKNAEEALVAAAAEKSLVASIATPTPTPAPTPAVATPQTQVAALIGMARTLREAGDTGTAMARLRQAQSIYSNYAPIVSEMAITYEKMSLTDKAIEQWRRIYQMGERAGIYYAAAEAKLRALQLPDAPADETRASSALIPAGDGRDDPAPLSLGKVGTTDDTGNTQPNRCLKLNVPIKAKPGSRIEAREVVIQVFFYEQLRDGTIVEADQSVTNIANSWARRINKEGEVQPVDWSTEEPETLEVTYAQPEPDAKDPRTRQRRNYFGYSVRVYYKGVLNAKFADPIKLLGQFIPPAALPSSNDLPQ